MKFPAWLSRIFARDDTCEALVQQARKIILTASCIKAVYECILNEINKEHEGITYLIGQVTERKTIAVSTIRPKAKTTYGSYHVEAKDMAKVINGAVEHNLQVVGQVHTHPGKAFHSGGDDDGAHIAYDGYASIVLPHHGKVLPSLEGAAFYMFTGRDEFLEVHRDNVIIVPEIML